MLNHAEVSLLLEELAPWQNAIVQKIQQPSSEEITFTLRRPGQTGWLHFAMQRGHLRFHLVEEKAPALSKPPSFSMALRKYLAGARLIGWRQPPGERIARFDFAIQNAEFHLIAEFIPPGGNLLLTDDAGLILARLFNDGRNVTVGKPYLPPPPLEEARAAKVRSWQGASFHASLAGRYAPVEAGAEDRKRETQAEKKRIKLLARLDEDWNKAGDPEVWRRKGDLLMTLPKGEVPSGRVEVIDETGTTVEIEVDPHRSVHENAERFYRLAKKADSARRHIQERRRLVEEETTQAFLPRKQAGKEKQRTETPGDLPPGHVFRFPGGSIIAAGRSAEENERITYGFARNEDYWLHARGVPGSHVVVRHSPEDDLESLLDDAARVALRYSFKRGEPAGDVQLTKKKYVQRVKGAPGKVNLRHEDNRRVSVDDASWAALDAVKVHKGLTRRH